LVCSWASVSTRGHHALPSRNQSPNASSAD
jgi:hypothetical protein